jgi:lipid A disaccharide synthetase
MYETAQESQTDLFFESFMWLRMFEHASRGKVVVSLPASRERELRKALHTFVRTNLSIEDSRALVRQVDFT